MLLHSVLDNRARSALAGAVLLAALGGGQAHAAAAYDGFAEAFLTITSVTADDPGSALPDDLAISFSSDNGTVEEELGTASAFAWTDEFGSVIGPFTAPIYDFSVYAEVYGEAGPGAGLSEAGSSSGWSILVDNIGSTGYTVEGELTYTLSVGAGVDDTALEESAASAFIVLEGLIAGDLLAGLATPTDVAAEANLLAGTFNDDSVMPAGVLPVSFYVPAFSYEELVFEAHADGVAEAVVPVPAAAWLFGSALLGLAAVTRHGRQVP